MRRKVLLTSLIFLAVPLLLAQDSPQAQQATDFKGVTLKNRAPISNEVLKVKFPKPVESKLKNGMELMVLEDHRSPTVDVEIYMPGSTLNDPPALEGIGEATASIMRLGTKTKDSKQIAETLAELGANISAGAGDRNFSLRFSTLTENLDRSSRPGRRYPVESFVPAGRGGQMEEPAAKLAAADSRTAWLSGGRAIRGGPVSRRSAFVRGAHLRFH